ncbi:PadR family transcriptional regulator [Nocardia sp. NPDC101769]|uniref:PadR family transcriptional regulator n=1 Tax=Nocardia sp. NPDC101769 TaxID=3364333 RepID=UPI003803F6EB
MTATENSGGATPGEVAIGHPLAPAVLGLLSTQPMHPYEMLRTIRQHEIGYRGRVNIGSLYNVVGALERRNLVEAIGVQRAGRRPPRTIYRITESGAVEFHACLERMLTTSDQSWSPLAPIRWLPPDRVTALLRGRRQYLARRIADLDAVIHSSSDSGLPAPVMVEAEFERHMLDAEAQFVTALAERLEALREVGGERFSGRARHLR